MFPYDNKLLTQTHEFNLDKTSKAQNSQDDNHILRKLSHLLHTELRNDKMINTEKIKSTNNSTKRAEHLMR